MPDGVSQSFQYLKSKANDFVLISEKHQLKKMFFFNIILV